MVFSVTLWYLNIYKFETGFSVTKMKFWMSTDRGHGIPNPTLNLFFEYLQTEDGILSHTKQFLNTVSTYRRGDWILNHTHKLYFSRSHRSLSSCIFKLHSKMLLSRNLGTLLTLFIAHIKCKKICSVRPNH